MWTFTQKENLEPYLRSGLSIPWQLAIAELAMAIAELVANLFKSV